MDFYDAMLMLMMFMWTKCIWDRYKKLAKVLIKIDVSKEDV